MPRRKTAQIFIVSDGRGETAQQLVLAAALQFQDQDYRIVRKSNVRTPARIVRIVEQAARARGAIFYTLVADDTRRAMRRAAGERMVASVDLLGPTFRALHDLFQSERRSTPGLLYNADRERFDRMEAIDYTLKHDDGQRPHELGSADVVLVGVSRASKSSTCFFLAYQGIRAANVPLLPDIEPPEALVRLPTSKVVGLRINVSRLMTVREARARELGVRHLDDYLDKRVISREVLAANRMMERYGWSSFDASYMAVEEIAHEVVRLLGLQTTW